MERVFEKIDCPQNKTFESNVFEAILIGFAFGIEEWRKLRHLLPLIQLLLCLMSYPC